ncbi:hypothetical protein ACHAXN_013260 [Cyclotella atomus]
MAPPKRPPPPKGPPPKRPPPPPSPPAKKPAPPGVGSGALKRPMEVTVTANAAATANNDSSNPPNKQRRTSHLHIKAPVILRDVTVFQRRQQVGEGTYGSVFVGADKKTGEVVALKRINTEEEENGFPLTAIREIKILKALNHPNVVQLKEIVTSKDSGDIPKNVFMVFEYLEYDLTGIIETPEIKLTQDHVKSWSKQLLSGVHYMHVNKIIHRDLKSSNLLINRKGELKIADWGLARSWNPEMRRLTSRVITLWYRPPELLLGAVEYTPKIDMWSVGCIIAEMFRRGGLLKGSNESTQLDLIFRIMGHPTNEEWPNVDKLCRLWKNYKPQTEAETLPRKLREELKSRLPTNAISWMTPHAMDLIDNLLAYNPDKRWSAAQALTAEWFFDNPMPKPAGELNMKFGVDSAHEWEARKKHKEMMALRKERAAQLSTVNAK